MLIHPRDPRWKVATTVTLTESQLAVLSELDGGPRANIEMRGPVLASLRKLGLVFRDSTGRDRIHPNGRAALHAARGHAGS